MEKIVWLVDASNDLIEIYNYISQNSFYYAKKTIYEILKKTEYLYHFPYLGRKSIYYENENYRELIYKAYKIIYEIDSEIIFIHRIWHSARLFINSQKV